MQSIKGGARGPVIFCLHESLNKLGFEVQAYYDPNGGDLRGIVAGKPGFIQNWVLTEYSDIPTPTDQDLLDLDSDHTL